MDANLKARVEATMRIPHVVEDGIVRDLRLLYEYATEMEAEVERLTRESAEEFAKWMATGHVTDAMRPCGVFERFRDYLAKKKE